MKQKYAEYSRNSGGKTNASHGGTGHYPANHSTGTSARDHYGGALSPLSDNKSHKLKVKGPNSKSNIG
jgi:hypothetical protein